VVKRDPTYAPAWALLALGYAFDPLYLVQWGRSLEPDRTLVGSAIDNAERAAREAIRLDPDLASGHAAVGWLYGYRGQWAAADRELAKALALDPSDPDALHLQSLLQAAEGRVDEALKTRIALGRLEPFVPIYNASTAVTMQINGDFQGAIRMLEPMNAGGEVEAQRVNSLALAYAATGQYQRAVDTILAVAAIPVDRLGSFKMLPTETADILRRAPATIDAPRPTPVSVSLAGWVYAFVGAPDRTLDGAEIWLAAGMRWSISEMLLWHPALAAARKTDRFKALVRKLGLVDYWRATRWPQSCHPVGGSDFACE
jgi:tetratricopeptide (TPR) repeat protein